MRLTDLNAHGGIGANCLLLELGDFNILIDTGLHPKESGPQALPRFDRVAGKDLDLIIITHCHLDHLAALPVLVREHPKVPVVMSGDSHLLYKRILKNSCNLMERQREESGGKLQPLYGFRDIHAAARQVLPMSTGMERHLHSFYGDRLTFSLHPSGHIPGATAVLFQHRQRRIFHTSDVLFADTPLLDGAAFPKGNFDTIVLETTRGCTERASHASRQAETARLLAAIRSTTSRGGSVLIPTFALGRMQEILTVLAAAQQDKQLRRLPIFVSGLGIDLLNGFERIARQNPRLRVPADLLARLGAHKLPESHRPGQYGPCIYLLSSGMMVENTPSYTAAAAMLDNPANLIAFVGYCDPDTPGGKLRKATAGRPFNFTAIGKKPRLAAAVDHFDLSTHADRSELAEFAISRQPRCVVLTHGDPEARQWFQQTLQDQAPALRVINPVPLVPTEV